jgi:hypothetical protein
MPVRLKLNALLNLEKFQNIFREISKFSKDNQKAVYSDIAG